MDKTDAQQRRQMYRRHLTTPAEFSRRIDDDDVNEEQLRNSENGNEDNRSSGECNSVLSSSVDVHSPRHSASKQQHHQLMTLGDSGPSSGDSKERAVGQGQGQSLRQDAKSTTGFTRSRTSSSTESATRPRSPRHAVAMAARAMTTSSMWIKVRSRIMSKVMRPDFVHPAVAAQERRRRVNDSLRHSSNASPSSSSTAARQAGETGEKPFRKIAPSSTRGDVGGGHAVTSSAAPPRDMVCSGVELDAILERYRQDWCGDGENERTGCCSSADGTTPGVRPSTGEDGAALSSSASASSCAALDPKDSQASLNSCGAAVTDTPLHVDAAAVPAGDLHQHKSSSHKKHSSKKKQKQQHAASDVISLSDVLYSGQLAEPPDVVFDDQGQTWDVYGAEFDPSILGAAIQKHLFKMMSLKSDDKPEVDTPERQQQPPFPNTPPQQQQQQMGVEEKLRRRESRTMSGSVRNFLTVLCSMTFRRRNDDRVDHV